MPIKTSAKQVVQINIDFVAEKANREHCLRINSPDGEKVTLEIANQSTLKCYEDDSYTDSKISLSKQELLEIAREIIKTFEEK